MRELGGGVGRPFLLPLERPEKVGDVGDAMRPGDLEPIGGGEIEAGGKSYKRSGSWVCVNAERDLEELSKTREEGARLGRGVSKR